MENQIQNGAALLQPRLVRKFFNLPLGTRFRYPGSNTVWVSLERHGCGKTAKWTDVDQSAILQSICSVAESDEECRTIEVELVDLPNDEAIRAQITTNE